MRFLFVSLLVIATGPSSAAHAELTFEPVVLDKSFIAYERDVGDIDGDGHRDLVAVQEGDTTLQVFRAPNWARATLVTFAGTYRYPRADDLKLADIDGDGDLDIVTRLGKGPADDGPGIAVWCENQGAATAFAQHVIGDSPEYVKDIVVADFDRDGHSDVAMRMDSRTQLWLQDEGGMWTQVLLAHPPHEGMEAGDIDTDGDPDLVLNGYWFETPDTPEAVRIAANYANRVIDSAWFRQTGDWTGNSCKVVVGDIDGDGRNDVAFSHSERPGHAVCWYRTDKPHLDDSWIKQAVAVVDYCHTLQAADFDLDGRMDLLVGGMIQSPHRGLTLMRNLDRGTKWAECPIQTDGSYSAELGDIDDDGDLDIVGIRNWNSAPTYIYRNNIRAASSLDSWSYYEVSAAHVRTFGLCFPDVDVDGDLDIASGPFVYLNGGSARGNRWVQLALPDGIHAFATLDVDGDNLADLIAQRDNPGDKRIDLFWVEAANPHGTSWTSPLRFGNVPRSDHTEGFQGYRVAQIVTGERPEIVVSTLQGIYYFAVPVADPAGRGWPRTFVATNDSDEGLGIADIDSDGLLDIAFTSGKAKEVKWAQNPGDGRSNWNVYTVGSFTEADWPDRCEAADLNGDGRIDIIATEENIGRAADALACWWEHPATEATRSDWPRHTIATQFTMNNLDVADMDRDGDADVILAEHRGAKRIAVWQNNGHGSFSEHRVSEGRESHLGGRAADLDGDGDLDLVSIAYDDFKRLHLWRNDRPPTVGAGGAATRPIAASLALAIGGASSADSTASTNSLSLAREFPLGRLSEILLARDTWHPFHTWNDRERWQALPEPVASHLLELGQQALNKPLPPLPATLYLGYARTGNRSNYEAVYFQRRTLLQNLVVAECVEGQGRFLDAAADALWSVCEESSWCLPAHVAVQKARVGLPDVNEPMVDLFAGETAVTVAWTIYLLGSQLDRVSPQLRHRAELELQRRILTPVYDRDDFGWMALNVSSPDRRPNNWTPWISASVLTTALLAEPDANRRAQIVHKMLRSLDGFLRFHPTDGSCDEGPGYWSRAGGSLLDCLDVLHSATGGKLDVYSHDLVRQIGRFIYRAYIADDYFVPIGDCAARFEPERSLVFRYGKRIDDPNLKALAAHAASVDSILGGRFLGRQLYAVFDAVEILESASASPPLLRDVWLSSEELQLMAARSNACSSEGLYVAAWGGHNAQSHNHNDVGNLLVFANGRPVLIDAGAPTYTAQTFSSKRYDHWAFQSAFHNLPTINGIMQSAGRQFAARQVVYETNDSSAVLRMDIAPAYPAAAKVKSWLRTVRLNRGRNVELVDAFELTEIVGPTTWNLLTPLEADISRSGHVSLRESGASDQVPPQVDVEYDANKLEPGVERIELDDARLAKSWGTHLNRLVFRAKSPALHDTWTLRVVAKAVNGPIGLETK
jgi:hypothetical protein